MTTLPDIWGINQRYILLAVNNWDREYQRVFLGGLTCDSEDYYNGESHSNAIFLPKLGEDRSISVFSTRGPIRNPSAATAAFSIA